MPPRKKVKTKHVRDGATTDTRRTTRSSSKAVTAVTVTADAVSHDQPTVAPVASNAVKLRRGCLKEIPDFAVEIQLMIFGNLHPLDLFNLSRTSKMFHDFFLHRSNEPLWEAALENAEDLPARPPWMSIPAFIHLLYSTHCHHCGRQNVRKVIWQWFARYCSNCLPHVICTEEEVNGRLYKANCGFSIGCSLHSIEAPTSSKRPGYRKTYWFLKRHVDELIDKWYALPESKGHEIIKTFRMQCDDHIRTQRKYAVWCRHWHDKMEEYHQDGLRNRRAVRFSTIVEKLKEMGWEKDLDFLGPAGLEKMSAMPVVRQSAKLTKQGWEQVQELLHTFLSETREARLEKERKDLIRQRFAELDEAIVAYCVTIPRNVIMDCHPLALDFAFKAEIESLVNVPNSENVTRETFATIVPQLVASWHAEQREIIHSLVRRFVKQVPPHGVDMLDLAIAVVYTESSSEAWKMRYPYVLTCSSLRYRYRRNIREFPSGHYAAPAAPDHWRVPYDLKSVHPKQVEVAMKWMRNIVTKLGLDPHTATFSDLEQCKARVQCLACAELGQELACTGEEAFAHTVAHKVSHAVAHKVSGSGEVPDSSHDQWASVPESDMAKVKEPEAVAHKGSVDSSCWWSCALCVDWKGRDDDGTIRKHLASEHNIEDADNAIRDGTIFWSPLHNRARKPAVLL